MAKARIKKRTLLGLALDERLIAPEQVAEINRVLRERRRSGLPFRTPEDLALDFGYLGPSAIERLARRLNDLEACKDESSHANPDACIGGCYCEIPPKRVTAIVLALSLSVAIIFKGFEPKALALITSLGWGLYQIFEQLYDRALIRFPWLNSRNSITFIRVLLQTLAVLPIPINFFIISYGSAGAPHQILLLKTAAAASLIAILLEFRVRYLSKLLQHLKSRSETVTMLTRDVDEFLSRDNSGEIGQLRDHVLKTLVCHMFCSPYLRLRHWSFLKLFSRISVVALHWIPLEPERKLVTAARACSAGAPNEAVVSLENAAKVYRASFMDHSRFEKEYETCRRNDDDRTLDMNRFMEINDRSQFVSLTGRVALLRQACLESDLEKSLYFDVQFSASLLKSASRSVSRWLNFRAAASYPAFVPADTRPNVDVLTVFTNVKAGFSAHDLLTICDASRLIGRLRAHETKCKRLSRGGACDPQVPRDEV